MEAEPSGELSDDELAEQERQQTDDLPQYVVDQLPTEEEVEAGDHGAGVKRGALVSLLTPVSKAQLIQTVITMDGEKANPAQICKHAGVGRSSWYEHVDDLLAFGVVEQVDKAGNSPLYRANPDDPMVESLLTVLEVGAERRAQATDGE